MPRPQMDMGIKDYAEVIREMMGSKDCEIIIDPRLGAATYQKSEGTQISSQIYMMRESMHIQPMASIDDGLQAINNLLSYDKSNQLDMIIIRN